MIKIHEKDEYKLKIIFFKLFFRELRGKLLECITIIGNSVGY